MKQKSFLFILALLTLCLTSCADSQDITKCVADSPSGFWSGLWHGIITPVSFISSIFWDSVSVYDVNNTGGWYDFGFLIGVGGLGFSTKSARD